MKGKEGEDGTQKVEEDERHQGGEKRQKEEFFSVTHLLFLSS